MTKRCALMAGMLLALVTSPVGGQNEKAQEENYRALMKSAGATVGEIKKNLEGDLDAVAAGAEKLSEIFDEVESFWINRDIEEAQLFAQDVMDTADELAEAAAQGEKGAVRSGFQNLSANCTQCHNTYREKLPDGSYRIK